jgi:hypothetical protein
MKANGVLSLEIDEQERGLVELRVICPRRAWPDKDPATSNQGSLQITYPLIKRSVGEISSRKNWSAPLNVELSLSKVELCNYPLLGIFRELGSSHLPSSSLVQKHSQTHSHRKSKKLWSSCVDSGWRRHFSNALLGRESPILQSWYQFSWFFAHASPRL